MSKEFYRDYCHLLNIHSNITKDKIYIFERHKPYFLQLPVMHCCLSRNGRFYSQRMLHEMMDFYIEYELERMRNEYRKFIEENKYGRVGNGRRTLSVPRVQLT